MGLTVGHPLPPAVAGKASPSPDILTQFERSSWEGGVVGGKISSLPPVNSLLCCGLAV